MNMSFHSIWTMFKLGKLWLNSCIVVYVLYFSVYILNAKHTVLSSTVCYTERNEIRTCHCNNENTKAVQCLLGDLNNLCLEEKARKSYKLFCEVMSQFNCQTEYSVKWTCQDCLDAYTNWLFAVFDILSNDTLSNCTREETKILSNDTLSNCTQAKTNILSNDTSSNCTQPRKNIDSSCKEVLARCPHFAPQNSYGDSPAFDCPGYDSPVNLKDDECNSTANINNETGTGT